MVTRTLAAGLFVVAVVWPGTMSAQRISGGGITAGGGTCLGHRVTEVVQAGDYWGGTSEADVVVVLGSGAEVLTGLGDDIVCVLAGPRDTYGHGATIHTGPGNDTVITYGGSNTIDTFDGDDLVYLNGDQESVSAGDGHDHIWGLGAASASIDGEDGNDLIVGSPGNDFLYGGEGVDMILAAGGDDIVRGEGDPDTLAGGLGFDDIDGGPDADTCVDTPPAGATFASCENTPPDPVFPESGGV
jgi:Ca2+-binding RTX toxin-like protein